MYAYVRNNPLNRTDPTGMNACGTKDDSSCKVTVTFTSRRKDSNGNYSDQFRSIKGQENYNATATVSINGIAVGSFLAETTPSDSDNFATLANGTYSATLTNHNGKSALRLQPSDNLPVVGGTDPATDEDHASGISSIPPEGSRHLSRSVSREHSCEMARSTESRKVANLSAHQHMASSKASRA